MADLVTDAAIDAVMRWLPNFITYTDEGLERARYTTRRNLEAAAPFIAAEALRQAADQAEDNYYNANGYVDNDASEVCVDIRRMADELERGK